MIEHTDGTLLTVGWISLRIHHKTQALVDAQAYPPYVKFVAICERQICGRALTCIIHKATLNFKENVYFYRTKRNFRDHFYFYSLSIHHQTKIFLHISPDQARHPRKKQAGHASPSIWRPVLHYFR